MMPNSVKAIKSLSHSGTQTDLCEMIEIWHDGSSTEAGVAVTAATITTVAGTTNTITLTINGAVDSRIGASGIIDCEDAAWDTAGEVYDHINSVQGWCCRIKGMLRAGVMSEGGRATMLAAAAQTCYRKPVAILRDSDIGSKAAGFEHGWVLSAREAPTYYGQKGKIRGIESEHRYRISLAYLSVTLTFVADTAILYVYKVKGTTETEIHQQASGATTVAGTWTPTKEKLLDPDEHILVLAVNVSAVTAASCDIHGRAIQGANIDV